MAAEEAVAVGSSDEADGGGGDVGKGYVGPLLRSNCLCDERRIRREFFFCFCWLLINEKRRIQRRRKEKRDFNNL